MTIRTLDGATFAKMVLSGANHLTNNAKMIDALNVFPVPDGDTGTNMNLSMTSGAAEVHKVKEDHVGKVANSLSKGLLMGARGNSGVILSQLFRGFAKSVETKQTITTEDFAEALNAGVKTAYKAVMKPVEGTILTVAKDSAEASKELAKKHEDIITFMEEMIKEAKASLKRTPELLPVLKEVGVVDSGGQGLVTIYEGFLANLKGEPLPEAADTAPSMNEMVNAEHHKLAQDFMNTEDIEFGYCTEFMVKFEDAKLKDNPFDEDTFRNELSELGDSLLVVSDDELVKVHVHAEHPGEAMNMAQRFGSLINIKIENMREQHTSIVGEHKQDSAQQEKAEFGIVTVAMGSGIKEIFESLGASVVIEGGQTMNPSTQDIADAIQQANAKQILVLPNNKNILMAADQAAALADDQVLVVPTKTVPQGMSAMLSFNPDASIEENQETMKDAAKAVKTGQLTYAVRDTQIDGMTIEKGNFMGILESKISSTHENKLEAAKQLLQDMIDEEEDEILTILYGEEASPEEVEALEAYLEEQFEDLEVEIHNGKQPIYSFIFSVE
ncbi:DAK2 domain-containing protein [Pontibacillus salicampi]|uniref:DAK2 domain-containing protein n=1 Tax=Pontibacillus salicampi TaxID=1449801 RepID=A0ABV6LNW9_9BACI